LLSEEEPLYSRYDVNLGLGSSLVRTGDNFRGDGGGLRAVARMGNWGGARRPGAFVWIEAAFGSEVGGWTRSDFPGSNYKVSDCKHEGCTKQ
jgi:hypothetical protein